MKTEVITLRISEEEKTAITEIAKAKGIPVGKLVRSLLRDYVKEQKTSK